MNFKELQGEMIAAMKAGDKVKKNAISNLIAAVKKVAIDEGVRDNITDELTDRVILKELKSIKEQIDSCPEGREELKADMKKRLEDEINRAAIEALPEEKAAELAKLVEEPDFTNEKMTEFIKNSGVNLTEVALETMLKFRSFYLGAEE